MITGAGPDKKAHVQQLIARGADLNHINGLGNTPSITAVGWGGQYDIALMLLMAGADHRIYVPKSNTRLVHIVAMEEDRTPNQPHTAMTPQSRKSIWTPQQAADYQKLVKWLEDHGDSIDQAKADLTRWQSWGGGSSEFPRKLNAEIAEREAREAHDNTAAEENIEHE